MNMELKACPFCGEKERIKLRKDDSNKRFRPCYFVTCLTHDCGGEVGGFYTSDEAVTAWNRRQ